MTRLHVCCLPQVVASGAVSTPDDVQRYITCTLLAATREYQKVR